MRSRPPTGVASTRTDAAVVFVAGSTALAVCDILWGSILMIMCLAVGMPILRPAGADLTSVEPDHYRSLVGRQSLAEPTRRR